MKRSKKSFDWGAAAKVAVGAVGAFAAGGGIYYLSLGAGSKKNTALIPKSIEDRLDHVVDALNETFDKKWVDKGIQVLEAVLARTLPPAVVALIEFVVQAEKLGLQNEWEGQQKKRHALSLTTQ